jgi:hypothetical protein
VKFDVRHGGVAGRLVATSIVTAGVLALGAVAWAPGRPRLALGVLGGGVLAAVMIWALGGVVQALGDGMGEGDTGRVSRGFVLVKFFTRHAILAAAAYVMMVRLHLDPVGMLVGVSSVVVAVLFEATHRADA